MKHETYRNIYYAHLGHVDKKALVEAKAKESDPFYRHLLSLMLEETTILVPWDYDIFTNNFRSGTPRERLDATVFSFILRIVNIIQQDRYMRMFRKPESYDAMMAWEQLLKRTIMCSLALLYNVSWTVESLNTYLEPAIMSLLNEGNGKALRQLMSHVGITLAKEDEYPAELLFGKLNFLHLGQYSAFYWRFLHWMALAMNVRKGMDFYKKEWLDILIGPLYRTLRCGICMYHFRTLLDEYKPKLMSEDADHSKLIFEMHNRVHALRRENFKEIIEPNYSEPQYEEDEAFMLQALSP